MTITLGNRLLDKLNLLVIFHVSVAMIQPHSGCPDGTYPRKPRNSDGDACPNKCCLKITCTPGFQPKLCCQTNVSICEICDEDKYQPEQCSSTNAKNCYCKERQKCFPNQKHISGDRTKNNECMPQGKVHGSNVSLQEPAKNFTTSSIGPSSTGWNPGIIAVTVGIVLIVLVFIAFAAVKYWKTCESRSRNQPRVDTNESEMGNGTDPNTSPMLELTNESNLANGHHAPSSALLALRHLVEGLQHAFVQRAARTP